MDFIKKETSVKGAICINAVGYEAVGDMAGNVSMRDGNGIKIQGTDINSKRSHDHSKVSTPAYQPTNPLQLIKWMTHSKKIFNSVHTKSIGVCT